MSAAKFTPLFNRARAGDVITLDTAEERQRFLHRFNQWRAARPHAANFRAKSKLVGGRYEITFIGQHPDDVRRAAMIQQYGEPQ